MPSKSEPVKTIRIRPTSVLAAEPVDDPHYLPKDPALLLHANPQRRNPVRFRSAGLDLAGHLYRPLSQGEPRTPGVVMCGPFSSVKEQTLPHYAERLADAGYTVLTFDSRNYGESGGEPRSHYNPDQIVEDYVNAVRYMLTRDDIDPDRIAVVGVCMGGGYAISAGVRERRIRAAVSIAGGFDIGGTFQQFMGIDGFAAYCEKINEIVRKQYRTGIVQYIPTIAQGLSEDVPVAAMPNPEAYSYYDRTRRTDAPNWSDKMTAASLEAFYTYNAVVHASLLAPTPLLIVHGTKDFFLLPEYAEEAYNAARGPKELVWIETHNHIELYDQDPYVSIAAHIAIEWLGRTLG